MPGTINVSFDGSLDGMRVDVYRNLADDCYSVKCMETGHDAYGTVVAHVQHIELEDVEFVVNENGREKAREEERKNVHAYVRGIVRTGAMLDTEGDRVEFSYDPFELDQFQTQDGEPIERARAVHLTGIVREAIV